MLNVPPFKIDFLRNVEHLSWVGFNKSMSCEYFSVPLHILKFSLSICWSATFMHSPSVGLLCRCSCECFCSFSIISLLLTKRATMLSYCWANCVYFFLFTFTLVKIHYCVVLPMRTLCLSFHWSATFICIAEHLQELHYKNRILLCKNLFVVSFWKLIHVSSYYFKNRYTKTCSVTIMYLVKWSMCPLADPFNRLVCDRVGGGGGESHRSPGSHSCPHFESDCACVGSEFWGGGGVVFVRYSMPLPALKARWNSAEVTGICGRQAGCITSELYNG